MLGKRVILREDHGYADTTNNPTNTLGYIKEAYPDDYFSLTVTWSNGTSNCYSESDLIFVDTIEPIKSIKKHNIV